MYPNILFRKLFGLVPVVFVRSGSKEKWEERLRRKCRVCKVHTIVVNSNTFK